MLKPFDASELIRQAIGGAAESQHYPSEADARVLLGRELSRQGKPEESAAAFAEAMRVAHKLSGNDEDTANFIQWLIESQVQCGHIEGAQTTAQTAGTSHATNVLIQSLIQHEKFAEAEMLIKALPANKERDEHIQRFLAANVKAISDETIGGLSALVSDEFRERFLLVAAAQLQKNNRGDVAVQVSKRLKEPAGAEVALFLGQIESLLEEKRFDEAIKVIDLSKEDDAIRHHLKRQVLTLQFGETHDEAVVQQLAEIYTNEEKVTLAALREEAMNAAKIPNTAERMDFLLEVLQEQFHIMDMTGAKQTLKQVAEQIETETDPAQIVQRRLSLAQMQTELRDKEGTKDNLGKLMQTLSAVKDLKTLKGLVPEPKPEAAPEVTAEGRIRLDLPIVHTDPVVDESAVRDQLFEVYLLTAGLLASADALEGSTSAFEKAKELARFGPATPQKAQKLLLLAIRLAEASWR